MTLDSGDIEAIAQRVAELIGDRPVFPQVGHVDVATVARMTGMSTDWVRSRAAQLGAVRMGEGKHGELRFDVQLVQAWIDEHRLDRPAQPKQRRRGGPARRPAGLALLPIPDKVGRR